MFPSYEIVMTVIMEFTVNHRHFVVIKLHEKPKVGIWQTYRVAVVGTVLFFLIEILKINSLKLIRGGVTGRTRTDREQRHQSHYHKSLYVSQLICLFEQWTQGTHRGTHPQPNNLIITNVTITTCTWITRQKNCVITRSRVETRYLAQICRLDHFISFSCGENVETLLTQSLSESQLNQLNPTNQAQLEQTRGGGGGEHFQHGLSVDSYTTHTYSSLRNYQRFISFKILGQRELPSCRELHCANTTPWWIR